MNEARVIYYCSLKMIIGLGWFSLIFLKLKKTNLINNLINKKMKEKEKNLISEAKKALDCILSGEPKQKNIEIFMDSILKLTMSKDEILADSARLIYYSFVSNLIPIDYFLDQSFKGEFSKAPEMISEKISDDQIKCLKEVTEILENDNTEKGFNAIDEKLLGVGFDFTNSIPDEVRKVILDFTKQ